jgi:hypothetical protein
MGSLFLTVGFYATLVIMLLVQGMLTRVQAVCLALRGTTSHRVVLRQLRQHPAILAVETRTRSRGMMLGVAEERRRR